MDADEIMGRLPAYDYYGNGLTGDIASAAPNKDVGYFQPQSSYTGPDRYHTNSDVAGDLRAGRFWDDYKSTGIPGESSIQ